MADLLSFITLFLNSIWSDSILRFILFFYIPFNCSLTSGQTFLYFHLQYLRWHPSPPIYVFNPLNFSGYKIWKRYALFFPTGHGIVLVPFTEKAFIPPFPVTHQILTDLFILRSPFILVPLR